MGNQDRSNPKAAPILVFQGKVVKVGFLNRVGQAVRPEGFVSLTSNANTRGT